MNQEQLTKYNVAAKICSIAYDSIVRSLYNDVHNVRELCKIGNRVIQEECNTIYKKENNKGIAYPTSVSLNNCVGNYVYEKDSLYNTIQPNDVVKIELGVNIGGCIAMLGKTIVYNNDPNNDIIVFLENIRHKIVKEMKAGNLNDDVRMLVESMCADNGYFIVENCMSYQQLDGHPKTEESKYIVFNHQKYYDDEDNLIVEPNDCFEFEENEVYTINLVIGKEEGNVKYVEPHGHHIARLNEYFYNLKLKNSREFYSKTKQKFGNNAFYLDQSSVVSKIGIKECYENGILDMYPILYIKEKLPIYHEKFTVIVSKDKGQMLKY